MKAKVKHLRQLLIELSKKTGNQIDAKGLQDIAVKVKLNENYLYKYIFLASQEKGEEETLSIRDSLLNVILKFLKFDNYKDFIESLDRALNAQLISCSGSYYSYVRRNAEIGLLFRSPVRMWQEDNVMRFELKGPSLLYRGIVQLRDGCLFILMESKEGKAFYHVYKIGKRETPKVLQGTFSGVSTAFDPIGGRTVLIKSAEPYDNLTNDSLPVATIKKSKSLDERRLAEYFETYLNNNVSPNKSATFGIGDLGECE